MNDPTADEFIEAMKILRKYTLSSQISLEGEHLVACVMDGQTVSDEDKTALLKLGWKLTVRDGKHSHFGRPFADH
jgi:hypothetical protein